MSRALPLLLALAPLLGCPITVSVSGGDTDTLATSSSTGDVTATTSGTTGTLVCDDPHAMLDGDTCYCVAGFDWCSDDPQDLSCCAVEVTTSNPSTSSTSSSSSSTDAGTSTSGSTGEGSTGAGSSSGGPVCNGEQLPTDPCGNGSFWCTMPEACGPEGSAVYRCVDGSWTPDPDLAKDNCVFDGYDFAYGCVDDGNSVQFVCGDGPGTACQNSDPSSCVDDKVLAECTYGKLTHFDCLVQCTEVGDEMGVLYDYGSCGEDQGQFGCLCCDMGDPGCPI